MKPEIIVRVLFPETSLALLREHFTVHYAPQDKLEGAIRAHGANVRGVVANGTLGLKGEHIRALPKLEMIQTIGVGFENIDMAAVGERGIVVANNVGTNSFAVAEQAVALILAVYRGIVENDRGVRAGLWDEVRTPRPLIYRKRVGIVGLGDVGLGIARRLAPFEATIGYHNRRPRDVPYAYHDTAKALAEASDILVVSCPGGAQTRHMIDAAVLRALGPDGILVNVGRGSVVDQDALVAALNDGTILGAGLDVFQNEPNFTPELAGARHLTVSPHIGGRSPETEVFSREQIASNLRAHFFGEGEVRHRIA